MNDQVPKAARITVIEAIRRVREAINSNADLNRFPDRTALCVTATMYEEGKEPVPPPKPTPAFEIVEEAGKARAIREIPESFRAFCAAANVVPRSLLNPWAAPPYVGGVSSFEDSSYDIAFSEYEQWAAPYLQSTVPRKTASVPAYTNAGSAEDAPASVEPSKDGHRSWQEAAREEADRVYLHALTLGYELSRAMVAGKVAEALKARGIKGSYGELSKDNIEREALRGSVWKLPTPK